MPVHRLHISGFASTTTVSDFEKLFSSFGTIVPGSIDHGSKDGNGNPRKFAFLSLDSTQDNLKRCMSLLSGSKFKGETWRIAVAKNLDYQERLGKEREDSQGQKTKKRKRKLLKGTEGREKNLDELTTKDNYMNRPGWVAHPRRQNSPIFPINARLDRPIAPPRPTKSSSAKEPPKIAPHVYLNPLAYSSRRHLREKELKYGKDRIVPGRDRSDWKCEVDKESGIIKWSKRGAETEEVFDFDGRSARMPRKGKEVTSSDENEGQVAVTTKNTADVPMEESGDGDEILIRSAKEKEIQERVMKSLGLELESSEEQKKDSGPRGERAQTLMRSEVSLEPPVPDTTPSGYRPVTRWVADESEDESSERDTPAAATSSPSSSSDSDVEMVQESGQDLQVYQEAPKVNDEKENVSLTAEVSIPKLKDIFKPQEGFSFTFSSLIPEELLSPVKSRSPSPQLAPIVIDHVTPVIHPSRQSQLFFPVPYSSKGVTLLKKWGLSEQQIKILKSRAESGIGWQSLVKRWKRTESADDIRTKHEEKRTRLTELVRKRHRESLRRMKKSKGRPRIFSDDV